jgi:hypothetical protein
LETIKILQHLFYLLSLIELVTFERFLADPSGFR